MNHTKLRDEKWLSYQYIKQNKSISDISKMLFGEDVKRATVYRWLKIHKIKSRGFSGHTNQIRGAIQKRGKYPAWNKGSKGIMPEPWNKGKGKGYTDKIGYRWVHYQGKPIMEHRFKMSQIIGRELKRTELVHHINGIKDDNRIENLKIVVRENHYGNVICPHCTKEFLIL